MKLTKDVYIVGSGQMGMHMTDAFDCHVYLIDGDDELALIDTGAGMGIEEILHHIEQEGFSLKKLKYLILTHAHADHAGGAKKLVDLTGVEVIASTVAADYLERGDEKAINLFAGKQAGFYPMDYKFEACSVARKVKEGDQIHVGRHVLSVLETPGHCEGHVSYRLDIDGRRILFAGDLVFYDGKVAIQFIDDCNIFALGNSLKKLQNMNVDTLFSGHDLFVLKEAQKHIDRGIAKLERLALPGSIIG
jgi:hydroxyacylglutathione hydrolase